MPIPQPEPRPSPSSILIEDGLRLEVYFPSLIQGGVGLLRLTGEEIESAQYLFRGESRPFFRRDGDAWYALVVAEMETSPRAHPLTVSGERTGQAVTFAHDLRVDSAGYFVQNLTLSGDRAYLAEAEIESAEFALLAKITGEYRQEPLWDTAGFELPVASDLATPFGTFRVLNEERETRHTGWDQQATAGLPIHALAAGEVVFAGRLQIRGNSVILDHGYGIFSGYAHFSELHVEAGTRVAAGQIVGLSGNSGRSSGPHLHWEIIIQGEWVDGLSFLDMWLPA